MGFKEYSENMSFVDMELSKTLGSSRTQRFLREIHDHINWKPLESILRAGSGCLNREWRFISESADPITLHRADTPDAQNKPYPVLPRQVLSEA